jgi:hypothetical protein
MVNMYSFNKHQLDSSVGQAFSLKLGKEQDSRSPAWLGTFLQEKDRFGRALLELWFHRAVWSDGAGTHVT